MQKRDNSTVGFRVFALPAQEQFDYERESTFQVRKVGRTHHFAHRHHGEISYNFKTAWPLRFAYLFDYSSGDPKP
ncbi:alginate export family protein [Nitrospira sp. M1]